MRLGGPFPFNRPAHSRGSLGGGQYFYIPPGQLALVSNRGIKRNPWWEPVLSTWRNILPARTPGAALSFFFFFFLTTVTIIDDQNMSGVVQGAAITNAGSGGSSTASGPDADRHLVSFALPAAMVRPAKGYAIIGGSLPALSIAQAGSGSWCPPGAPVILTRTSRSLGRHSRRTAVHTVLPPALWLRSTLVNPGAGYTVLRMFLSSRSPRLSGQLAPAYTARFPDADSLHFPPGRSPSARLAPRRGCHPATFDPRSAGLVPSTAGALAPRRPACWLGFRPP